MTSKTVVPATDSYLEIGIGAQAPEIVRVVIETPQDSTNKYEYDDTLHIFYLDRVLHSPVNYPGDYGFIPGTIAQDGDPLDILVLGDSPAFTGCVYTARPVGLFDMLDNGTHDEKIVAYAMGNPRFQTIQSYTDIEPHIRLEVEHFFSVYKNLEEKHTEVLGWRGREEAYMVIRSSQRRFKKVHPIA